MTRRSSKLLLFDLKELSNLRCLEVVFMKVTDAGVADLKKSLPNCQVDVK